VDEEQRARYLKQIQEIEVADLVNIATGATPKVHTHAQHLSSFFFVLFIYNY
jgi:leucyl aminopeptidase